MHVNPHEMQSLRAALRNAVNQLDAHFDPRTDAEKSTLPPVIGAEWLGGIYVGKTLDAGEPAHLVLLPGDFEGSWDKASGWAAAQNGALPSRVDLLVLFANTRDQFKAEWYWSSETAGHPEYAWFQGFNYGDQSSNHKDYKLRARAVRRVPIQ